MNWLTTGSEHINRMASPHKCMLKTSMHPACILQASKHSSSTCGDDKTQKHATVHVHTDSLSKRLDLIGSRWKLAEWMGSLLFSISCYFQHNHPPAEAEEQLAETNSSVFVISNLCILSGFILETNHTSWSFYTSVLMRFRCREHVIFIYIYCPCAIQQPLRQWRTQIVYLLLLKERTPREGGALLAKITQKAHLVLS